MFLAYIALSALIGLVLTLIFLPFQVVRAAVHALLLPVRMLLRLLLKLLALPLALFRLSFDTVLFPIRMAFRLVLKNVHLVVLLCVIIALYQAFKGDGSGSSGRATMSPPKASMRTKQSPNVIDNVTMYEDGDSTFSTDLYAQMTPVERQNYSQQFYWAMSHLPDEAVHSWNHHNIAGAIRANGSFNNNNGARCRAFDEVLKVHHIQQNVSGIACSKGDGSWCKLRNGSTPVCGLSRGGRGMFDGLSQSLRKLF